MKTLKVPDMHCEKCVERISTALHDADIDLTVSLADKTVSVDDSKTSIAMETLDDLGFTAVES